MSFRELRNFTEIMRNLGYPRLISMENFRTPNFVLVSDILYWLVQRYDQNVDIPDSIATESDRIAFLKSIAQLVYYKARIKLNIKKLYGADGYAVKELLKLATVLNTATLIASSNKEDEEINSIQLRSSRFQDNVKNIRIVASELTDLGSQLYDLLEEELDLRKERQMAISQPHNIDQIKHIISKKNIEANEMISSMTDNINSLKKDEDSLKEKLKSKSSDLARSKKRLLRMQGFRPGFMDEFEGREKELQELYTQYVERYRNIEYLENELDKYRKAEAEAMEENGRRLAVLRKKMKEEELAIMRGDHQFGDMEQDYGDSASDGSEDDEDDDEDDEEEEDDGDEESPMNQNMSRRPRAASGRRPHRDPLSNPSASASGLVVVDKNVNSQMRQSMSMNQQSNSVGNQPSNENAPNNLKRFNQAAMMYNSSDESEEDDDEEEESDDQTSGRSNNNRGAVVNSESEEESDGSGDDYSDDGDDEF